MIIPVRCFTCGKCLANKYQYYEKELIRNKISENPNVSQKDPLVIDLNADEIQKTFSGKIMDELGLTRMCCRKTMLTSINMIEDI